VNESSIDGRLPALPARHRMIWRWHFYAGLFCIPFIIWLSVTGAIYLFKPQFEAWQDHAYEHLPMTGAAAAPSQQVAAALAAAPGTRLNAYQIPRTPDSAAQIIVGQGESVYRAYVNPQSLEVLQVINDDHRPMQVVHDLHGRFLIGDPGSILTELAASWGIVMIVSGLYLWWPRDVRGLGGVLYPRLSRRGRPFWRDLHGVVGFWVSAFALFLIVSGLPWTHFWGSNFRALRQIGQVEAVKQDWATGRSAEMAERVAMNRPADGDDEHAQHRHGMTMAASSDAGVVDATALDRIVATLAPMPLAQPVKVYPPSQKSAQWYAWSLPPDRTQRVKLTFDAATGAVRTRQEFSDKRLIDRIVGVGVSAHEGQLFGWFNQVLGLLTTAGLIALSLSGFMAWFKRRPQGLLGAPPVLLGPGVPAALWGPALLLGLLLPMLGLSMIAVLIVERLLLRRIRRARDFLGLQPA